MPPGGACQRCHRRKVRCDKAHPCAPCVRARATCLYTPSDQQLRRQNYDRFQHRIHELEAENSRLSAELRASDSRIDRGGHEPRSGSFAIPSVAALASQTDDQRSPSGRGDVASEVISLSLSAGGGRDFVGPTSGVFLANLLQPQTQPPPALQSPGVSQSSPAAALGTWVSSSSSAVVSSLPSRTLAREILNAYQCHNHVIYPFLSLSALDRAFESVYVADGAEAPSPMNKFLVDMTLAIGTAHMSKFNWHGISEADAHYQRALTRLTDVLSMGGINGLQALLLVCQYRMGTTSHDTTTNVWHLIGAAARTCFELGLHRSATYAGSQSEGPEDQVMKDEDTQVKLRCFWCIVAMDRVASLTLGRPMAIQLEDVDVELPAVDIPHTESTSPATGVSPTQIDISDQSLRTAIFVHILRYRLICGKILNALHRNTKRNLDTPTNYLQSRESLAAELRSWYEETAGWLVSAESDHPSPAANSSFRSKDWYSLLYHNGMLMLFRPSPNLCDATSNSAALQHMFDSSQQSISMYASLHQSRKINYSWVTLHALFMAGLSYIFALRNHFQHLRQSGNHMDLDRATLRSTPSIIQVVNDTRACSKVLVAVSERWAMARNCSEVFDKLADAVVADVVEAQAALSSTPGTSMPHASDSTGMNGNLAVAAQAAHADDVYGQNTSVPHPFNMTVDDTLLDCFGDLQNLYYDQYHSDSIAQLSQEWMFGIGNAPNSSL